ncbi:MAG: pyridoxamine 5'-phosphate oxidase [Planctomycetes bacterium]|nr:pyridoxamine 5'-phosphate oxidase [Planctomycetota bacterium]
MTGEHLPDPLPTDPMRLFADWFEQALGDPRQPNPASMYLATADADGCPTVRTLLCKHIELDPGYIVFYTNYQSRKAADLDANPRAAALFHWDHVHRQVRAEGRVVRSPDEESDAYFKSRALLSQLGAWASDQSRPIESQEALMLRLADAVARFGVTVEQLADPTARAGGIPRPPHWGGYRLYIERLELWVGAQGRLHDRAVWSRTLSADLSPSPWSATRLQP